MFESNRICCILNLTAGAACRQIFGDSSSQCLSMASNRGRSVAAGVCTQHQTTLQLSRADLILDALHPAPAQRMWWFRQGFRHTVLADFADRSCCATSRGLSGF